LGIKNQLSDVITIIKYSPDFSQGQNIQLNGTLSIIPEEILKETLNKIKKVMSYRLRLLFERRLSKAPCSRNPMIASMTNGFWAEFHEEIFYEFLVGIRGGGHSFKEGYSFKIESDLIINRFRLIEWLSDRFFNEYNELKHFLETCDPKETKNQNARLRHEDIRQFQEVSDRALNTMLQRGDRGWQLEVDPTHKNIKRFQYNLQFCFGLNRDSDEPNGTVEVCDDPELINFLTGQPKIPPYETILARDARNQCENLTRQRSPLKRKHVIQLYWALVKAIRKKIRRSVLREILPDCVDCSTKPIAQSRYQRSRLDPRNADSVELPPDEPDKLEEQKNNLKVYFETIEIELAYTPEIDDKENQLRMIDFIIDKQKPNLTENDFEKLLSFFKDLWTQIVR
jgi:hypothetical protein